MSADAIAIRRAVAATRRAFPKVDVENIAEICIRLDASIAVVKGILFDEITAAAPPACGTTSFRRANFASIVGAERRSL